jgi:NADPH:quinone reductase-like Zn-dependent oxidoreductase
MKAAVIEKQGGIENIVYRDFPDPKIGPDDLLIRVKACGLNYFDVFVRRGMPGLPVPMPWISGADVAGEVAEVGANVKGWKVGDRCLIDPLTNEGMMGEEVQGGMAEYSRMPNEFVIPLDPRLSFVEAACIPANYGTTYRMLFTNGDMQSGDLVLVLGASGGVGTATVQVVNARGSKSSVPTTRSITPRTISRVRHGASAARRGWISASTSPGAAPGIHRFGHSSSTASCSPAARQQASMRAPTFATSGSAK